MTRTSKSSSSEARAFVVVLEEIRAQNKAFGEGLQGLREQVDGLREQVDGLRERMDAGFEAVDRRFDRVEGRLDAVEGRLGRVEDDVGLVKIAVLEHSRELKEVRVALEKKVDREEVEAIVERIATRGR